MERGEVWLAGDVWLADVNGVEPVVLLGGAAEIRAVAVVPAATEEQKSGFVFVDPDDPAAAGPHAVMTGIEVPIGADEGLDPPGVVRLALPYRDHIFCTWELTLAPEHLVERLGTLAGAKLARLDRALRLSAGDPQPEGTAASRTSG